jgi:hypothetical protein
MSTVESGSGLGDSAGRDGARHRYKQPYGTLRLAAPLAAGEPAVRQPREVPPPQYRPGLALQVLNLKSLRRPPG